MLLFICLLSIMPTVFAMDYYAMLGVSKTATDEQIDRAWRKKALELHPDKPSGSVEKMQALNEAHAVLKDPQRRAAYDKGSASKTRIARATKRPKSEDPDATLKAYIMTKYDEATTKYERPQNEEDYVVARKDYEEVTRLVDQKSSLLSIPKTVKSRINYADMLLRGLGGQVDIHGATYWVARASSLRSISAQDKLKIEQLQAHLQQIKAAHPENSMPEHQQEHPASPKPTHNYDELFDLFINPSAYD